jgi:hypothetical protein
VIHRRECLIDRTKSDAIINYVDYLKSEVERRRNNENGELIDQEIADLNQCQEEHKEHIKAVEKFLDSDQPQDTKEELNYCRDSPEQIVTDLVKEITASANSYNDDLNIMLKDFKRENKIRNAPKYEPTKNLSEKEQVCILLKDS